MRVDLILYSCIYVSATIIVFDLIYSIMNWHAVRTMPRKREYVLQKLEKQKSIIQDNEGGRPENILLTGMRRRLLDPNWLVAYAEVYKECCLTIDDPDCNDAFQQCNVELFLSVVDEYQHEKDDQKAFFAYVIYELIATASEWEGEQPALQRLARKLAGMMHGVSFYTQINTFRALVKIGYTEYIFYALTVLNDRLEMRNAKFFSDYLLEMKEDNRELIDLMLTNITDFSVEMQILIIQYLRLLPQTDRRDECNRKVAAIMTDPDTDGETVMTAILYFGRHRFEPVYEKLLAFIDMDLVESSGINYAALAARALATYPSEITVEKLIEHLGNSNWHVRFNSADSLIQLGVDYEAVLSKSDDRFAREMFIHRTEADILRKGGELYRYGNN